MRLISVYRESTAKRFLYELLRERSTEDDPYTNISHRALPSWRDHVRFVQSKPYRYWYLIKEKNVFIGSISATKRNEIGIVILRAHRGKSYGTAALMMFLNRHRPVGAVASERSGQWLANINPLNGRSIGVFTSLGFAHIQNTYALRRSP